MHKFQARPLVILVLVFTALLSSVGLANSTTVTVGDKSINIPIPEGFILVTPDMTGFTVIGQSMQDPQNVFLGYFIPHELEAIAKSGNVLQTRRWLVAKAPKDMLNKTVTLTQLKSLEKAIDTQQEKILAEAEKKIPDVIEESNKRLQEHFKNNITRSFNGLVPLGIHHRSEAAFSMSMRMNVKATDGEQTESGVVTITTSMLNADGKILNLHTYTNNPEELAWTQETGKNWAKAVIAANPPAPKGSKFNVSWISAIVSGLVVGLITLIKGMRDKKKEEKEGDNDA